jgi:hypothetical protein
MMKSGGMAARALKMAARSGAVSALLCALPAQRRGNVACPPVF